MDISPLNGTQSAQPVQSGSTRAAISSDFETFLKMLTAQLQNQDPLNPVDSADYAVQLATFSSVEQQVLTNDLLTALTGALAGNGLGTYAGWVGMEVRAAAPIVLDGGQVTLAPSIAAEADRAEAVIYDSTGASVARIDLPLGPQPFVWDGTDGFGTALPAGVYSFQTESFARDAQIAVADGEIYAEVIEAQSVGGTAALILQGGIQVDAAAVTAIRPAAGS